MLPVILLLLLVVCSSVRTTILENVDQADLEAVRIRLMEEKAKRLLVQNDVDVLMLQFEELKRRCDQRDNHVFDGNVTLVTHIIAFTATLSADMPLVSEQTVIFDNVKVNEGNCYDSSTGRFRAPFRGLYSFSVTVLTASSSQAVHCLIMKDKDEIGKVYSGVTGIETGSVTVVTMMDKGQVVFVKEYPGHRETVHGNHWSTFTGLLHYRYN
ncbi:hypothetical protein CHS0354_026289 [Potamilus streckersoni]|uniref:C1q domain-containing protein n=1 Tax=Potamilus streckersoni TaxID=2493646 RepID=A0AAE0TEJ2_9BIVA|nr:hypothetical protein CHS0354_026289 [Potamilus streckersoni]